MRAIESGRQEIDRLSTLIRLAEVLDVAPDDLIGWPLGLMPNDALPFDGLVGLRRALLPRPLEDGPPADLAAVRRDLGAAWALRARSAYAALGAALPPLVARAKSAAGRDDADRPVALALLAQTYYLAGRLAQIAGDHVLWATATSSGVATAQQSGDEVTVALGAYWSASPLMLEGRCEDARDICIGAAERLDLRLGPQATSTYGVLMQMAAVASARGGDSPGARDCLAAADQAAGGPNGEQRKDLYLAFGPANVALHRVSVATELGETGECLRLAERFDATAFPAEFMERRCRVLFEVARAHAAERRDGEAMAALLRADALIPEEVARQRVTRDIVLAVVRRRRRSLPPGAQRLAESMGIPV